MKPAVFLCFSFACSYQHGSLGNEDALGSGGGVIDGNGAGGFDVMAGDGAPPCQWSYTPTNFDPCALPAPAGLAISQSTIIDTATTTLPKMTITQSDETTITVIHLSQLSIDFGDTLTLTGTGVVLAVDGQANISGTIVIAGGSNDATHCTTAKGENGADSGNTNGGGGGAGGGAAGGDGGDGGDGNGTMAGVKGTKGTKVTSTMTPLRGGCEGGNGGRRNGVGTATIGGRGGGALQISSNAKISMTTAAFIDSAGRGGAGAGAGGIGGAGGGAGGAIFLEGPNVDLDFGAILCADGGSGGEGGGQTAAGNTGNRGECNGFGYATTSDSGTYGGDGGHGTNFANVNAGNAGNGLASQAAGGGGGGGVGWIRIRANNFSNGGAIITPAAALN